MSDTSNNYGIPTLLEKHEKNLINCKSRIQQLDQILERYNALYHNLYNLVQKTTHSIWSPICHNTGIQAPLAYMRASFDHTNQILVLLGENWFVEASTSQSLNIIQRRIKICQEKKEQFEKELENLEKTIDFTKKIGEESQEYVEIVEKYDEEEEAKWRERHKLKVKDYKEKVKKGLASQE